MFSNFDCGTEKLSNKKIFRLSLATKAGRCNTNSISKFVFDASIENRSAIDHSYCVRFLLEVIVSQN